MQINGSDFEDISFESTSAQAENHISGMKIFTDDF